MANTSYPNFETYGSCSRTTNIQPLASNNEMDFNCFWIDQSLEKEISRGEKLRLNKPQSYKQLENIDAIYVDFIEPPCIRRNNFPRKYKETKLNILCSTPRKHSPFRRTNFAQMNTGLTKSTSMSRRKIAHTRSKSQSKCSMRIAELAVPSKRQCIDTWRNRYKVLPDIMVERLKLQIMDQKPVVQIPDALRCFKKVKVSSTKRPFKKIDPNRLRTFSKEADIKSFCAIFGHKIAKKLNIPLNITLNAQSKKISEIVAREIEVIITNRKYTKMGYTSNEKIRTEISNKIAIWMLTVLEESSYKLLEEDLRELEEEEGPVLDAIDDLVDNVVSICEANSFELNKTSSHETSREDSKLKIEKQHASSELSDSNITKSDASISEQHYATTYDTEKILHSKDSLVESPVNDNVRDSIQLRSADKLAYYETVYKGEQLSEYFKNEINQVIDRVGKEEVNGEEYQKITDLIEDETINHYSSVQHLSIADVDMPVDFDNANARELKAVSDESENVFIPEHDINNYEDAVEIQSNNINTVENNMNGNDPEKKLN